MWQPDTPRLDLIRRAIVANREQWRKVRGAIPEIEGEALKRPPTGFDPEDPFIADLKRKGFTAGRSLPDSEVIRSGFPKRFLAECKTLDPLNRFLAKAIGAGY
jgi:uncharacterized protein (DUF2461 family)